MTIANDSPIAIKIREGYEYTINRQGVIEFGERGIAAFNHNTFLDKLKAKTATLEDIQEYLLIQINNGNS